MILSISAEPNVIQTYLGGSDIIEKGKWQWLDGSKFNFINWIIEEPDNVNNVKHILILNADGTWTTGIGDSQLNYLCSMDLYPEG